MGSIMVTVLQEGTQGRVVGGCSVKEAEEGRQKRTGPLRGKLCCGRTFSFKKKFQRVGVW